MKNLGQKMVALCFGLMLACSAIHARAMQSGPASSMRDERVVAATILGSVRITDGWRFRVGDDPAWANPAFDDTSWDKIDLKQSLLEQGIESYTGYAWYRLRLRPVPAPESGVLSLSLMLIPYSVGQVQVMANGAEAGRTLGMSEHPHMYQAAPINVPLGRVAADGTVLIAIRTWIGVPTNNGALRHVELGDPDSLAERVTLETGRQWERDVVASLLASFLFLAVAVLAATLYMAQRNHSEYLWLALLCISVSLRAFVVAAFALGYIPIITFNLLNPWAAWFFTVTTLEFILRFTAIPWRRFVRVSQIAVLLLPITAMLHLEEPFRYLSLISQFFFCTVIIVMLWRAWRRGRPEAGVMLLPFFLAATADSIDILLNFAANRNWVPPYFASHRFHFGPIEYDTGTIAYLVFLCSVVAVILYRFVDVSQEEQRSAAEIEAARSVQALLIPTRLPSNRNFMFESAYLPANGVGGDFFQVLPLKDDSMLIVVGDVSGKGLQAAMNASTLVGALRNEISHDPATVLSHLNQVMIGAMSAPGVNTVAGFATCLCARIYPSGQMTIANAGHLSPYRDGRELELAACLPLGVIPNVEYEQMTVQLKHGDRLTFLSDGVVEATDPKGELFGFERTQQVSHEPARYIAQIAQRFGQTDDITVVSLYFVPA